MELAIEKITINGRHRRDMGDVESLARSIEQLGLLHPVVVTKTHRLIAGERRLEAYRILKREFIPVTIAETIGDALTLLLAERDENTCRKDFAPSEAVAVGAALEAIERPKAAERKGGRPRKTGANFAPVSETGKTREKVAAAVGMSHTTYEKAKAVVEAAKTEPEKFAPLLAAMDETGKVDKAYRQLNAKRIDEQEPKPLPTGTFDLILADPPWSYDASETETRHLDNHYPTISDDEICGIVPPAAGDAVLFLWATAPKLPEAMKVMNAWGFAYRTNAVWDKEKIGMGYWFRGQHELLLVGTRGTFRPPMQERRVSSVIRSPRSQHSVKPECVYELIESMFPKARRLEMFARRQRDGWTAWGNQA